MFKVLVSLTLLFIITFQQTVLASPMTFEDCMTQLNNEIQKDINKSFPLVEQIEGKNNTWRYTYDDISKMVSKMGKRNSHLESLMAIFYGSSIGDRQLIIIKNNHNKDIDNASSGYLFYKVLNGTNILLELKRGDEKWEVVKKRRVRGKYITLEQINKECVRNP